MISEKTAKVLIIDDFHPVFTETLRSAGLDVTYEPDFNVSESFDRLKEFDILAVRSKMEFNQTIIDRLPDLKCIARGGAGMDNIDEKYALSKGISLLNAPEGNRDAVAEHTIGLLLTMSNNILKSHLEVASFKWDREGNRGWEIGSKIIGLFGYGNTGSSVAAKLSGFSCKVLAYDRFLEKLPDANAEKVDQETLLRESDVISFHVPLNAETSGMINRDLIERMKTGVVVLNTSRGKIARLSDVWEGIKSGKIRSYATDVLENENMAGLSDADRLLLTQLISGNQFVITPHIAGWTYESYEKIGAVLAKKILDFTTKSKFI